jgi:CRP-like cAMP-binding protein
MNMEALFRDPCVEHFGLGTTMNLADNVARELFRRSVRRRLAGGEVLLHAGDVGDTMALVCEGRIGLRCVNASGRTVISSLVGSGGVVGLHTAFEAEARHPFTAIALVPTHVRLIRRDDIRSLSMTSSALAFALGRMFTADATTQSVRLVEHTWERSELRIRRRIVEITERFGKAMPDGAIRVIVTHDEIAEYAGAARPTVTTLIGQAARDGVLVAGRRRLDVFDLGQLRKWAEAG